MAEVLKQTPETKYIWQITTPTGGFGGIQTVPWSQRERTTQEISQELYGSLAMVPQVKVFPMLPASLPGAGNFGVEMVVTSSQEPEELQALAKTLVEYAVSSGMFLYADTDLKFDQPQARITLDRAKLADLGLDPAVAGRELSVLLSGGYVNRFNLEGRSYTVIPQLPDAQREYAEQLLSVQIARPDGSMIPVSSFANIETQVGPRSLNR